MEKEIKAGQKVKIKDSKMRGGVLLGIVTGQVPTFDGGTIYTVRIGAEKRTYCREALSI